MGLGVARLMLLLGAVAWLATVGSPASVAADSTARAGGKLQGQMGRLPAAWREVGLELWRSAVSTCLEPACPSLCQTCRWAQAGRRTGAGFSKHQTPMLR